MKRYNPMSAGSKSKFTLVPCTSKEKSDDVTDKGEEVMVEGNAETIPQVLQWEHSIFSQSTDEDRTDSDDEVTYPLHDDDDYQTIERKHYRDLYRHAFVITGEKYLNLTLLDKLKMEFRVGLTKTDYITHLSNEEDIYQKLKSQGRITMPKKFAMPYIRGAIRTKSCFHELNHTFKLIKKLLTLVPCIKAQTDDELLTEFLHHTGLARGFSKDVIFRAIYHFKRIVKRFEEPFHPIIRKDRIKEMIAYAKRYRKIQRRRIIESLRNDHIHGPPRYAKYLKLEEEKYQSSEAYKQSLKVVQLHQEFHRHITSCKFIKGWSRMDHILQKIRARHPTFPQLSDKWTFVDLKHHPSDWTDDQKQDELLLHKIKKHTCCQVSYGYLMEGILDYIKFSSALEREPDIKVPHTFDVIASSKKRSWEEAFYDRRAYKHVYRNMSTVFA